MVMELLLKWQRSSKSQAAGKVWARYAMAPYALRKLIPQWAVLALPHLSRHNVKKQSSWLGAAKHLDLPLWEDASRMNAIPCFKVRGSDCPPLFWRAEPRSGHSETPSHTSHHKPSEVKQKITCHPALMPALVAMHSKNYFIMDWQVYPLSSALCMKTRIRWSQGWALAIWLARVEQLCKQGWSWRKRPTWSILDAIRSFCTSSLVASSPRSTPVRTRENRQTWLRHWTPSLKLCRRLPYTLLWCQGPDAPLARPSLSHILLWLEHSIFSIQKLKNFAKGTTSLEPIGSLHQFAESSMKLCAKHSPALSLLISTQRDALSTLHHSGDAKVLPTQVKSSRQCLHLRPSASKAIHSTLLSTVRKRSPWR